MLDSTLEDIITPYLEQSTWRTAENANATYSLQGLMQHISTTIVSRYWLNSVYSAKVRSFVDQNRFHIHDLGFLGAYCSGWSTSDVLEQGFGGVADKIQCKPPKHLNTALNQLVNFLFTLQGEMAGAQALSNVDTYLAPFIRADGLTYQEVFKYVQSFVYSLNVPTRSGFQAPFTNISLDLLCPKNLAEQPVIIGGKLHETWKYGEFQNEMDMFNTAFAEVMKIGDGNGTIFSFPIPTYVVSDNFDWEADRLKAVWDMTAKYGTPYFANFMNSELDPSDFRSMCCRLRLDTRKLQKRSGGLFGSAPLTGSLGVVTLNLPNLALRSSSPDKFIELVTEAVHVASESLEAKRELVESNMSLYPYATHYLKSIKARTGSYFANHFSTIGVIGMNEACQFLFGAGIREHGDFALKVLNHIKEHLNELQNTTGHLYNLEATPGESTCYKLAQKDQRLFPAINVPSFYTNSTMLPVDETDDLFQALAHQEPLQKAYTGGTVVHGFIGERLASGDHAKQLVRTILGKFQIPYLTLTPTFSICRTHGYLSGEQPICPQCGEEALVYSRIVGYYRPVKDWNKGKKEEFTMRKTFRLLETDENTELPIGGFNPTTYCDFPGHLVASILFTQGCNLNCSWCHNKPLLPRTSGKVSPQYVLDYVAGTSHRALVVCGGEPTIHKQLVPFLRAARERGITVKLDTNGSNPTVLQQILDEKLVSYVAMDLKCAPERYSEVAGMALRPKLLQRSVQIIKESGVDHQFRTTQVPELVDIEDMMAVERLAGESVTRQEFRG